jgi:hypothetical protein
MNDDITLIATLIWKEKITSIEDDVEYGVQKFRDGEKEIFIELCDYWKYNDHNPEKCKSLLTELNKHQLYHEPSWKDLKEFSVICERCYTKDEQSFKIFQDAMGGKIIQDWADEFVDILKSNKVDIDITRYLGYYIREDQISDLVTKFTKKYDSLKFSFVNENLNKEDLEWISSYYKIFNSNGLNKMFDGEINVSLIVSVESFWSLRKGIVFFHNGESWDDAYFHYFLIINHKTHDDGDPLIFTLDNKNFVHRYISHTSQPLTLEIDLLNVERKTIDLSELNEELSEFLTEILNLWK